MTVETGMTSTVAERKKPFSNGWSHSCFYSHFLTLFSKFLYYAVRSHGLCNNLGCFSHAKNSWLTLTLTLKTLKAGHSLNKLGYLHIPLAEVISEATLLMAQCYGSKKEVMSDVRVELWANEMSKKRVASAPHLKCLPPTTEAFAQNVSRAHLQAAIWRSALSSHPPSVEVTQYGWSKAEASETLIPVTTPQMLH